MRKKRERASKSEKERDESESNAQLATSLTCYKRDYSLSSFRMRRGAYQNGDLRKGANVKISAV